MDKHNQSDQLSDADDESDRPREQEEKYGPKANSAEPKEGAPSNQHPQKQSISKDAQK